jgi:hypothetical protein
MLGSTAATPSGLMLKAKNVNGSLPGFPIDAGRTVHRSRNPGSFIPRPVALGMSVTESVVLPPNFKVDTPWNTRRQRKGHPLLTINLHSTPIGRRNLLKNENIRLKDLVVRLSETVIRLVMGKK